MDGIPDSHKEVYDTWLEKAKTDAAAAKLVRLIEDHPREELYDTLNDPYELNNLADRPAAKPVLLRLRGQLAKKRKELGDADE